MINIADLKQRILQPTVAIRSDSAQGLTNSLSAVTTAVSWKMSFKLLLVTVNANLVTNVSTNLFLDSRCTLLTLAVLFQQLSGISAPAS
jgi:hypothetical protein